ncbi:hypothetical protein VTO42DRAFT_5398 [Malbranchea cinnamomea]
MDMVPAPWSAQVHAAHSTLMVPRAQTPLVISPLPEEHRRGLIAVGVTALLSVVSTVGLFSIITYRLIFWRHYFRSYIGYNQYVILIYNLLLADLQEALGFLFSLHWVHRDALTANTGVCFAQGWLLQIGDPSSGLFVFAIAIHTFVTVVLRRKIPYPVFVGCIVAMWLFCLLLVGIPSARYRKDAFAPTGPWCWLNEKYEAERLWLHYFWIFFAEFGSIVLYAILFFYLRRRVVAAAMLGDAQTRHVQRLRRVTGYMVLYPLAYLILSLPLAAGRMAAYGGNKTGIAYYCATGALIASSGWVDVVMYAFTRRALLTDSQPSYQERAYSSNAAQQSHIATITADHTSSTNPSKPSGRTDHLRSFYWRGGGRESLPPDRDGSTETIVRDVELVEMGKVYQETTIEITHERLGESDSSHSTSASDQAGSPPRAHAGGGTPW